MIKKIKKAYSWIRHEPWRLKKRDFRFLYQRVTRGWDDSETWNLDYSLAAVILPRLKRFREVTIARPVEVTDKEWSDILDKMIAAFEFANSETRWLASPEEYKKYEEGFLLFAKYYFSLWW